MTYLPIFVDIRYKRCLVVGGGKVATRKVAQLLRYQAQVTVVAPVLCDALQTKVDKREIAGHSRPFSSSDVEDCTLIIAATDDNVLNQQISRLAKENNVPVNVVDNPALCSFIMPSVVDRSPVQIAISSSGTSPVLARLLRAKLETLVPASYGHLAKLMQQFRDKVKARFPHTTARRRFWEDVLNGPVAERMFAGHRDAALAALERQLEDAVSTSDAKSERRGEVYLIGAGPGDPDLLTFRALRLLQQAEIVLYDRLVAPAILSLARKDAQKIYVGKQRDKHTLAQQTINQRLVDLAKTGHRVARLKGGDPFIFGRGGEEIDSLSAAGIAFQVVPGITAASGCAAYAGIPLTHRDYAQSCLFVTGHLKDGSTELNWDALVQPQQTIVVYMGLHGVRTLCQELICQGMTETTPCALIERGTTPAQQVHTSTLKGLPALVERSEIHAPTLIIIGEVVRLRETLRWYR